MQLGNPFSHDYFRFVFCFLHKIIATCNGFLFSSFSLFGVTATRRLQTVNRPGASQKSQLPVASISGGPGFYQLPVITADVPAASLMQALPAVSAMLSAF